MAFETLGVFLAERPHLSDILSLGNRDGRLNFGPVIVLPRGLDTVTRGLLVAVLEG